MVEKKEKLVPGVFVRSQKITAVKPNMVMKVSKFMDELGIGKLRSCRVKNYSFLV